jgi:hypothetical protein
VALDAPVTVATPDPDDAQNVSGDTVPPVGVFTIMNEAEFAATDERVSGLADKLAAQAVVG